MHELGLHTQFIGEIKDVKIDESCLDADGKVDVRKLDQIVCAIGAGGYFAFGAPIGPAFSIGKAFTISMPSREQAAQADYFGLVSGRDADKLTATGLTPVAAEFVDAPCVAEFPLVVEC